MESGRPVMTREQLIALAQRVLHVSTLSGVIVRVHHTVRAVTRLANDHVLSSDDGEILYVQVETSTGGPPSPIFQVFTNQIDDETVSAALRQCEDLLRASQVFLADNGMKHMPRYQDAPAPVRLWHDATVDAMTSSRQTMIPQILQTVQAAGLQAAGFVAIMARAEAAVSKEGGVTFFHDETDSEVTVSARDLARKGAGWSGQTARDWRTIDVPAVASRAVKIAKDSVNPVAVEPGRRTAILTPTAVAQLLRHFAEQWSAVNTDAGLTALSKSPAGGNKLRQRIFDRRLKMTSDPADPDGGYRPYMMQDVVASPPMTWVEDGVLKNLAYDTWYAMERGKQYADLPFSFRLSGGTTPIDEMITKCQDGIFVNAFSNVEVVDRRTCLLTGATRDGCFLVRDGKISKSVKNFRFLTSPFFFLNNIEAMGVPERAAFGYTPVGEREQWWSMFSNDWPRLPLIVPPLMVRDFNFNMLADAV